MLLDKSDLERVYFLTRTSLPEEMINSIALSTSDFEELIYNIKRYNREDLERDWALFDFYYKKDRIIYAKNFKIISEKEIFRGTYIHECLNNMKYLLYIIDNSAYCKKCDTQFFPRLWWESKMKEKYSYYDIKYNNSLIKTKLILSDDYRKKLLSYGVDYNFLNKIITQIHSQEELEKFLLTKYYDQQQPPPANKIHDKLNTLYHIWSTRPIKRLGIHPECEYFFHKCTGNIERITFFEKNLYSWCPFCFSKFLPEHDTEGIKLYEDKITVICYTYSKNFFTKEQHDNKDLLKNSDEYFYLSILGFNKRTTCEEILSRFRYLSKIYHPDYGGNSEMFQKIVKAKDWLLKFYTNSLKERIRKENGGY